MSTSNLVRFRKQYGTNAFKGLFVNEVDYRMYQNNFDSIKEHGGEILSAGMVPFSKIDISRGAHQTRANDYDIGHIKILTQQIRVDGLSRIPIVEWCEDIEKFCVLSGHHRIYALKELNEEAIPVCVANFSNFLKKEFWKQLENQHKAVKPHATQDAVKFIVSLKDNGYKNWNTSKNKDVVKREVYSTLREAGYKLGGAIENRVFMDAFKRFAKSTITTIAKEEAEKDARTIFNQPKDRWKNDTYVIASGEDASRKCLMVACRTRSEWIYKTNQNLHDIPRGTVNILTYFPKAYKDKNTFEKQRKSYLEKMKILNLIMFRSINLVVEKIYFSPQLKDKKGKKESGYQRYRWDSGKRDFIKEKK